MTRIIIGILFTLIVTTGVNALELSLKEQIILKKVLAHHNNNLECDGRGSEMQEYEFIRFKKNSDFEPDTIVVLVSCSFHAYQVTWVGYSTYDDGAEPEISILSFPSTNDGKQWTASTYLMSPNWVPESQYLIMFYKGRGKADCGSYAKFKWNGNSFYAVSVNYQACCWDEEAFEKDPRCKRVKDIYPIAIDDWPLVYKFAGKK